MTTIAAWGVAVTLVAGTVLAHLPRVGHLARRTDVLGLLPAWSFFAPNPGTTDPALLVRDRLADGCWTEWRVVWHERHARARWLWRPGKRVAKLVGDAEGSVASAIAKAPAAVVFDPAFLLLARMAEAATHDLAAEEYQFAVVDVSDWWSAAAIRAGVVSPVLGLPGDVPSRLTAGTTSRP